MSTFKIYTLGCKVNQYESEAIAECLENRGLFRADDDDIADVCIINTCTVTSEADRKSRQIVRRASSANPGAKIIVTGCTVETARKSIDAIDTVDAVVGNSSKLSVCDLAVKLLNGDNDISVPSRDSGLLKYEMMSINRSERVRAYIKIEDGCDKHCAYCIISKARGNVRSRPVSDIIDEATRLAESGYKEIILTGIEVSEYRGENGEDLADVIVALDGICGVERVGFSSVDPAWLRPETVDRLAHASKLTRHIHLSLQSGCSEVLAHMRRAYNAEIAMRNINHIKEVFPDMLFSADVIVGFPGESENNFIETENFIRSLKPIGLHVFTYSRRPGTEADAMQNQIDEDTKNDRSNRLISLGNEIKSGILADIASEKGIYPVLFEQDECVNGEPASVGRLSCYAQVIAENNGEKLQNSLRYVKITSADSEYLYGVIE